MTIILVHLMDGTTRSAIHPDIWYTGDWGKLTGWVVLFEQHNTEAMQAG